MSLRLDEIAGEEVILADTDAEFAAGLETGLPVLAPPELAERFGYAPDLVENVGTPEDILLPPEFPSEPDGEA